jgi:polysaccharide export outer membrane protein
MEMANRYRFFLAIMLSAGLFSCGPSKKAHEARIYLRGIDTSKNLTVNIPEPIIHKSDILSITVFSNNPEATALYNQLQSLNAPSSAGASSTSGGVTPTAGYLVDIKGNIYFQDLGLIKVEGLTKLQLTDTLNEKLKQYLTNPYVEIRFLNARVTMLGEINKPGTINIPEQRISILDAIALSGDLTVYGKKDNILIVREKDGMRQTARLNLLNPAIYESEYFYLQQNDLVYIEPIQKKPKGDDQALMRTVTITATIVSTIAIVISLFR